jgi:hypothetical protein
MSATFRIMYPAMTSLASAKRPVDDSVAAVADADLLAFLCWAQRRAATQYALPDQTHRELANPLHGILSLLGGGDPAGVLEQDKQVLHRFSIRPDSIPSTYYDTALSRNRQQRPPIYRPNLAGRLGDSYSGCPEA